MLNQQHVSAYHNVKSPYTELSSGASFDIVPPLTKGLPQASWFCL